MIGCFFKDRLHKYMRSNPCHFQKPRITYGETRIMKILPFVPSHQHLMDVMNTSYHFTSSLSNCENSWLGSLVWWMGEIKSKLNQACSVIQKLSDPNATTVCTIQNFKHHISNSWSYHWTKSVLIWSYHVLLPQTWLLHQELEFALWPLEQEVRPMAKMNPLIALINYLW